MRAVLIMAIKDLRLLWRDKFGLFWVIAFPLLFAIFFGTIFSGSGGGSSSISIAVVDQDSSAGSREFVSSMRESEVLKVSVLPEDSARDAVRRGKLSAFLILEPGFGDSPPAFFGGQSRLTLGVDPSRKATAAYLQGILTRISFQQMRERYSDPEVVSRQMGMAIADVDSSSDLNDRQRSTLKSFFGSLSSIMTDSSMSLYTGTSSDSSSDGGMGSGIKVEPVTRQTDKARPRSSFQLTFPAAIIWGLLGCAASFGISMVKERSGGTYLRLRLAPLTRAQILAGKGLACFLACIGVTLMLLVVASLIFGVRSDQPGFLALAVVACALCFVGIMMTISVLGKTEEGVAGAGWAILLVMAMLGGGMIPLFFMPGWLQTISSISPIKWSVLALEGAIWRGFTLAEMALPLVVLVGVGIVCFGIGVFIFSRSEV